MSEILLLLNAICTLAMVGLIWFVQVVHYPLFSMVGDQRFQQYEISHQRRTTLVVAPLMLIEAATAGILVWFRPEALPAELAVVGFSLVVAIWASTFFWQVPAHERLAKRFDAGIHQRLVRSNWLRTAAWTARGALVSWAVVLVSVSTGTGG